MNDLKVQINKLMITLSLLSFGMFSQAQITDSLPQKTGVFSGAVTVTTKGLSTFPNLTLGKPAAILDLSMGTEKFRFEPVFRFALEGKPWTFIFWCRYELLMTEKFQFKLGTHPAYSFKTITITENGNTKEILRAQQYLAVEASPVFRVAKNMSLGPYYLHAWGMEKDITQNSDFIAFKVNLSNLNLNDKFFMKLMAQAYYLKLDAEDGFYLNSTLTVMKRNFPFSISSTINKTIQSTIPGNDFLWNVNLTYTFNKQYARK